MLNGKTVSLDGSVSFFANGKLHNDEGPASILSHGVEMWMKNGRFDRSGGLPALIDKRNGIMEWWENGTFIRAERILA